ncbi:MAG: hypothetical protein WA939_20760 [Nodosilinea sp.]
MLWLGSLTETFSLLNHGVIHDAGARAIAAAGENANTLRVVRRVLTGPVALSAP